MSTRKDLKMLERDLAALVCKYPAVSGQELQDACQKIIGGYYDDQKRLFSVEIFSSMSVSDFAKEVMHSNHLRELYSDDT